MQFLLIDIAAVFTGLFGFWATAALTDAVRGRVSLARRERHAATISAAVRGPT
jgi:hypothetical protein